MSTRGSLSAREDIASAGAATSGWSAAGGYHSSIASSIYSNGASSLPLTAHPAASSALPTTLHPSAAQLTPLPNFSHESLGAYQLRIDSEFAGDLFSLKHNSALGVHQKTAMCLDALERLANSCIVHHGATVEQPRLTAEQQQAQSIMAMLSSSRSRASSEPAEEQIDGVPLSQHHAALRSTILNLRSMLLPLMVAPRTLFQTALNRAEEVGVKYNAIAYETDQTDLPNDSLRIGPDGTPIQRGGAAALSAHEIESQRREEERRAKEERLQQLDQLLREHDRDDAKTNDDEDASADAALDAPPTKARVNYKFLFARDEESGLDPNTVPYYEVIQHFQFMKTALSKRLLLSESAYLESVARLHGSGEDLAYLKEANRRQDVKVASTTRSDMRLHDEFTSLREKLSENYHDLKKLRAKNAEMKRNMRQLSKATGLDRKTVTLGAAANAARGQSRTNKEAKKQFEDLVMTLKEHDDEIAKYVKSIASSNAEKDNLTTQVEILEQAVQTMRYMIQDMLKRINESDAAAGLSNGLQPSNPTHLRGEGSVLGSSVGLMLSAKNMIACRGIGRNVPKFLAYSGWVRRYDLGKRHTELIIKEIWALKTITDETRRKSGLKRTTLQEFFLTYLRSRFPYRTEASRHRRMELTYNFVESCEKYRADHDMDLFNKILFGQCSEERYIDQMTMMAHFKKCLAQMDIVDGVRDGYIHKMVFFAGLRQFFPVKREEHSRALIEIVLREMQTRPPAAGSHGEAELVIDISKLMAETSDGDESAFMNAIRNQYEAEVDAFPQQIAAALHHASRQVFGGTNTSNGMIQRHHLRGSSLVLAHAHHPGEGWLPAGQIAAILQDLDPAKSKHEIDAYMRRGLATDGYFQANAKEHAKETTSNTVSNANANTANAGRTHQSLANSRSSTPQHGATLSISKEAPATSAATTAAAGAATTPQKGADSSPGTRKGSLNNFTSPNGLHRRHESFGGGGGVPGALFGPVSGVSTPVHDRAGSGSSPAPGSAGGGVHTLTSTRSQSRISVGAGLTLLATQPTQPAPANTDTVITASTTDNEAGITPGTPATSTPTAAGGSGEVALGVSPAVAGGASGRTSREGRRRSSGSRARNGRASSRHSASPHPSQGSIGSLSGLIGLGGVPTGGYSYDPCHFVELAPFLERLNTLFLHRTGHYNADLDIPGLHKLIKDELERQADEERKAREAAAAKRGLGVGLQVNAANLPPWSALAHNFRRGRDNVHAREDLFVKLLQKYAIDEGDANAAALLDANGDVRRVRMPIECEREGSADAEASAGVTLRYTVDRHLNQVVTLYRGDATKLHIDAVVNAANPQLVAGGGICAAIFAAAGHNQLSKACAKLGGCAYGQTKATPAFKMPAKFILHSVSPVDADAAALASCYTSILDLCRIKDIRSVAICCLATGIYGSGHRQMRSLQGWTQAHLAHSAHICMSAGIFSFSFSLPVSSTSMLPKSPSARVASGSIATTSIATRSIASSSPSSTRRMPPSTAHS